MSEPTTSVPSETGELIAARVEPALAQIRLQVVGVGVAFLVLSLSFSAFVLKQNRSLVRLVDSRQQQIQKITEAQQRWIPALNELAGYSLQRPDLKAIFTRYGIQIGAPATP